MDEKSCLIDTFENWIWNLLIMFYWTDRFGEGHFQSGANHFYEFDSERPFSDMVDVGFVSERIFCSFRCFRTDRAMFRWFFNRSRWNFFWVPVMGNFSNKAIPGMVTLRPKYCFHVLCIFPAGSCMILLEKGRNWPKKSLFPIGCCGIQSQKSSPWVIV
jgi:hypothetical protein